MPATEAPIGGSSTDSPVPAAEGRRKVELLQSFIKSSIGDVGRKRKLNQQRATIVKVLILCMTGGATLLLGLNLGPAAELPLKNVAFALTSLVTVFNALEPFFNYRALWVEHERANAAFFQVKDRLDFYVTGRSDRELDLNEVRKFYDEYERVWAALSQAWTQQRLQYENTGKQAAK
jgi:hypothetical protein